LAGDPGIPPTVEFPRLNAGKPLFAVARFAGSGYLRHDL